VEIVNTCCVSTSPKEVKWLSSQHKGKKKKKLKTTRTIKTFGVDIWEGGL